MKGRAFTPRAPRRPTALPLIIGCGSLLAAVLAPAMPPQAAPPEPLSLHPQNPHYFRFRDRPTVLITSGEH